MLASYYGADRVDSVVPVDPVRIARSLGINVYQAPLTNTLSGMLARLAQDSGTDLILNSEHAPVRQRFTAAHELGHYFYNLDSGQDAPRTFVHRRDTLSACGVDAEEVFANQFAAELLMPEEEVRRLDELGFTDVDLARRLNVSVDAITYRLKNLGLRRR